MTKYGRSNFKAKNRIHVEDDKLNIMKLKNSKRAHSQRVSDFWLREVGFQKSDIAMPKQSLQWEKIGYGLVGWSNIGQKIKYPFIDGPLL